LTFQILLSFICKLSQKEQNLTLLEASKRDKAIFWLNEFKLDEFCTGVFVQNDNFNLVQLFCKYSTFTSSHDISLLLRQAFDYTLALIFSFKIRICVQDLTVFTFNDIAFLE